MYDIERYCDQLMIFPFSDEIEKNETLIKFNALKCPIYNGIKDLVTYMLHFKTTMAPISIYQDKGDVMICKIFATTLYDEGRNGSTT